MADNQNPFGGLLTPDVLAAQRQAESDKRMAGLNVWQQMAANAGLTTRASLAGLGFGNSDDQKAQRNQAIMQQAESKYGDYVAKGLPVEDAQAAVLEDAIKEFADRGDYQSALSLTQPLDALKRNALERQKLKAEATNLEANPELKAAQAQATLASIDQKNQMAQAAADRVQALIAQNAAANEIAAAKLDLARQNLELKQAKYDLEAAMKTGGGLDKSTALYQKTKLATDDKVMGAGQAAQLMARLREISYTNPAALTKAGTWATAIGEMASAGRAAMSLNNYDIGEMDYMAMTAFDKAQVKSSEMQSAALDLAYAFARVRDPGGRLSNQDVNMAIEIVQGKGSPASKLHTLEQNYRTLTRDMDNFIKLRTHQGYEVDEIALDSYHSALDAYQKAGPKKAPTKAAPAPSALPPGWAVSKRTK